MPRIAGLEFGRPRIVARPKLKRKKAAPQGAAFDRLAGGQRTKSWTSLVCVCALVDADRVTRSGGNPMSVSERMTVSAWRLALAEARATWPLLPRPELTATRAEPALGRCA